jgi:hypothetical protein
MATRPTKRQRTAALKASIRHWQEDLLPPKDMDGWHPPMYSEECALCTLYDATDCAMCPLGSCGWGSYWDSAENACKANDRPAFMRARHNLIRRMKRALKREDG